MLPQTGKAWKGRLDKQFVIFVVENSYINGHKDLLLLYILIPDGSVQREFIICSLSIKT